MAVPLTNEFKSELYQIILEANQVQSNQLKKDIKNDLQTTVDALSKKIDETVIQNVYLQKKCLYLERKLRKNNIIIFGLDPQKETLIADTINTLNRLLNLNISKSDINNIYIVGTSEKPPVIVEFLSFLTKTDIFKNITKLRGTGVSITNDLSVEDRNEQKVLYSHLKLAREQKLQARISGNKLIIDNNPYTVEQLQHLENLSETESADPTSETEVDNPGQLLKKQQGAIQSNNSSKQKELTSPLSKKRKINYSPKAFLTDGAKGVLTRSTAKKL